VFFASIGGARVKKKIVDDVQDAESVRQLAADALVAAEWLDARD